jgi:hypothetical protein
VLELVRDWFIAPLVGEDYVRDVPVAPEALASRLRSAVNVPPKRVLGVLKIHPEWIGIVAGTEFVVWERRQHATRAVGKIRGRRGGSRVEARIAVTRRTWVMMAIFFALFVLASIGLLSRQEGLGLGPTGLTIAALGGFVTLSLFWSASLRQRAALKAFLNEVLRADERSDAGHRIDR